MSINADITCVGFGPAAAGFLYSLSSKLMNEDGTPRLESKSMPGMPLQILCYERSDGIGYGVSGVVSKAKYMKQSLKQLDDNQFPMCAKVSEERLLYLLDPIGASRRNLLVKIADGLLRATKYLNPFYKHEALRIPFIPHFLNKHGGYVFSVGQFLQWISNDIMATGAVQIWPSTPASEPIIEQGKVKGIRLSDQGVDKEGNPTAGFMPGMNILSDLTVVADGPVGNIGLKLDELTQKEKVTEKDDWAVGMKAVIELAPGIELKPGTVFHTLGFPEPEIFGFLYALSPNVVSCGIFIPSWLKNPVRTAYRYMQHWMQHPYLWQYLKDGTLRSWGAKSLAEYGIRGEPVLAGDGFARIGENTGSTNVLTNSGVDEAWATGVMLADAVEELILNNKDFNQENLDKTYTKRRKQSQINKDSQTSKRARDGFHAGFVQGMIGMALNGFSFGKLFWPAKPKATYDSLKTIEAYFGLSHDEVNKLKQESRHNNITLHDLIMNKQGWPEVNFDGKLLVSHQDALLVGGKVQAAGGYIDHVKFRDLKLCDNCNSNVCVELCSGQAITLDEKGLPTFDREKCVHCGACLWNCEKAYNRNLNYTNISFEAGAGGLHSAEN